jgi:hypothetical protein
LETGLLGKIEAVVIRAALSAWGHQKTNFLSVSVLESETF